MKKKLLSVLIAMAMVGSLGTTTVWAEEGGEKTVVRWLANFIEADAYTPYVQQYNEMQDEVEIEIVDAVFANTVEYYEALSVNMASDEAYDIFNMSPTFFNKYVENGVALCVDEWILENDDVKDYAKDIVSRDGHAYAYPCGNDLIALFVNVDMLEAAGYTLDDLSTWDGMLEAAAATAEANDCYGCVTTLGFGGGYPEYMWYSTMWGEGGDLWQEMDGSVTVTNPEGIAKSLAMWRDLITTDAGSSELHNDSAYMLNKQAAMKFGSQPTVNELTYGYGDITEGADFEWAVVPIPASKEDVTPFSTLGGWTTMINGKGAHTEEAVEFMNWLYFESGYIADKCKIGNNISPLYSADEQLDELYKESPFSKMYALVESGQMELKGELAFTSDVLEGVTEMMTSTIFDTTTDEEALQCVQTFIDKFDATVVEK